MGMFGTAFQGNSFNFGNTAKFYLRLREDVTYTSESGSFLTAAAPILAVPEPLTLAMFVGGLGTVGWVAKGRSAQRYERRALK